MRYCLYVDESGDHTYNDLTSPNRIYLGITGVAIECDYYRHIFQPGLEELKQKHFPHTPDEPLILHREDIYNRRHEFGVLTDPVRNEVWENDLIEFIKKAQFRLFTIVINKQRHRERYDQAAIHPYHLCLAYLLERYRGYLTYVKGQGDVLAESRGGKEDLGLKRAYINIYEHGTYYISYRQFQNVLTSKQIKIKGKEQNIAGLQLADLIAHPAKMSILAANEALGITLSDFTQRMVAASNPKYDLIGKKLIE